MCVHEHMRVCVCQLYAQQAAVTGCRMREAGERVVRQAGGAHTTCVPSHSLPPQPDMTESDEEVVSNSCCGSVFANGAGEVGPPCSSCSTSTQLGASWRQWQTTMFHSVMAPDCFRSLRALAEIRCSALTASMQMFHLQQTP